MKTTSRRAPSGQTLFRSAIGLVALGLTPAAALAAHPQQDAATDAPTACACTCATCLAKHGAGSGAVPGAGSGAGSAAGSGAVSGAKAEVVASAADILGALEALEAQPKEAQSKEARPKEARPKKPGQERGYMGVTIGEEMKGVTLMTVVDESPAANAGLKAGDVIVAVEEMPVRTMADLQGVLAELAPGDVATFEIERGDDEMKVAFPLGSRAVLDVGSRALIESALSDLPPLPPPPPVLRPAEGAEWRALDAIGYSGDEEVRTPLRALGYIGFEEVGTEGDSTDAEEEVILLPTEVREVSEPMRIRLRAREAAPEAPEAPEEARPEATRMTIERVVEVEEIDRVETRSVRSLPGRTPLPPGYIEIETRRELRPGPNPVGPGVDPALRDRIRRLEREVAELSEMVEDLRRELARRNPR